MADLLAHRAGLAWVDGTMSVDDMLAWDPVVRALERQAPSWPPGTAHGYHATTYGWLVGEVVRRVTGVSIGTYLRNEIAGPLDADFFIGLPAVRGTPGGSPGVLPGGTRAGRSRPISGRSGDRAAGSGADLAQLAEMAPSYLAEDGPLFKALMAPGGAFADQELWHSPRLHAAEIPAANGICDARSLARLYGACVSEVTTASGTGFRILSPEQVDRAVQPADGGTGPRAHGSGHPVGPRVQRQPGTHRSRPAWEASAPSGTSVWVARRDGPIPMPSWPWAT